MEKWNTFLYPQLYDDEKRRVINNMNSWSNNGVIDKDGKIFEK